MLRIVSAISAVGVVLSLGLGSALAADSGESSSNVAPPEGVKKHWDVLNNVCTECHNYMDWAGEIAFDTMRPEGIPENAKIWETAIRKLQGGLMPPPGNPRPSEAEVDSFVAALENYLDAAASGDGPDPGRVAIHRLNRQEYVREVNRLFGLQINPASMLPQDTASDGFTNVANVLNVSPSFMDQYIAAARDISIRAVGEAEPTAGREVYPGPEDTNPTAHVEGLPLGTRGGMRAEHYFPADGTYEFNIDVASEPGTPLRSYGKRPNGWLEYPHTLIMTIDGERVFKKRLGGPEDLKAVDQRQTTAVTEIQNRFKNIRIEVPAGTHTVGVTFVARTFAHSDDTIQPLHPGEGVQSVPRIKQLEVLGPYDPTGLSRTVSRERIFICHPERGADARPCAEKILRNLARQAFRRPVTEDDMKTLMGYYEMGRKSEGFETGIQKGIMVMLASPKFLYRVEPPPGNVAKGAAYHITELQLASRLSFFLWSQGPDERLLDLATAGKLDERAVLKREVQRMLADPRAEALVENFAFQWLQMDKLEAVDPDPEIYPNFDENLRDAFRREIKLFVESILLEDRNVLELLSADHTFVNGRLAHHYGIGHVRGDGFQRVALKDSRRHGLLGKGAVLMASSYPNRTSPVLRGAWLMETIIGAPPSPPPPGVETNLDQKPGEELKTVAARLKQHRSNPSCNMCHGVIDPLGLALENFNAIGGWRDKDRFAGRPIQASGKLATGQTVSGPIDLRQALLDEPERFVQTFTEKLMTYALGRGVEYHDMPVVRSIVDQARKNDYRFSAIVMGIVMSDPFQMRRIPAEKSETQEAAAH